MIIAQNNYWKIGELAKLTGLTIRTLRYYDEIGLYSPSEYTAAGYRLYNDSDISRLQQILTLKNLGLSLEEIKSILEDDDYNPYEIVSLQINRLKKNIRNQQKLLKELQYVSSLMEMDQPLMVEDFTKILNMMRQSHEEYFTERKTSMMNYIDKLEIFLNKQTK